MKRKSSSSKLQKEELKIRIYKHSKITDNGDTEKVEYSSEFVSSPNSFSHSNSSLLPSPAAQVNVHDVVWAKITGYPWWPSIVRSIIPVLEGKAKSGFQAIVDWVEWNQSSFIDLDKLFPFETYFEAKFDGRVRSKLYRLAVSSAKRICHERKSVVLVPTFVAETPPAESRESNVNSGGKNVQKKVKKVSKKQNFKIISLCKSNNNNNSDNDYQCTDKVKNDNTLKVPPLILSNLQSIPSHVLPVPFRDNASSILHAQSLSSHTALAPSSLTHGTSNNNNNSNYTLPHFSQDEEEENEQQYRKFITSQLFH